MDAPGNGLLQKFNMSMNVAIKSDQEKVLYLR